MAQATRASEQLGKGAEDSAKRADTAMGRMVQSAQNNRQAWDQGGRVLTAFGAATVGALGLATKAAMDWESSWAGVQKTVDGTAPQMEALESGLRGLARELPSSHAEIAAVAEAAGQLGIETPNILGFTRTMVDMGEATNITAEEAAVSLSRFMNITQTSQGDVGKLGASIVGLGNNFASTESEIVATSLRIAGAGEQAGLTEGEIFGMATALSSVGIEAEAGGTAISRTMKRIGMEVDTGGDKLGTFAQVAGMSAEEFSAAWRDDPAAALESFVTGLADTEQMGMSTNQVLSELGITAIRESDALLRLSGAGEVLGDAMAMGNSEFEKGTALMEEASKRYETAESRIAMAKNALVDMGISVGAVVLPAVAELGDGIADVAGWFADLPGPVHATVGALAGVAGVAGLGAGAFLLIAPRVLDTVSAFKDLGAISPGTASKVGRVTLGIGKVGLAAGVAAAAFPALVSGLNSALDSMQGIDRASLDLGMNELSSSLMDASRSGNALDSVFGDLYESGAITKDNVENLGVAVQDIAAMDGDWFAETGKSLGLTRGHLKSTEERFNGLGEALVMMSQTDLPQAQAAFSELWDEAEAGGASFDEMLSVLPGFRDELIRVAESMGAGTDDATLLKIATGELSPVVDEATGAVDGFAEGADAATGEVEEQVDALAELQDQLQETTNAMLGIRGSARDMEAAFDDAMAAAEENGKTLDITTEAGRANEAALDGIASATQEYANAQEEAGASAEELDGIMASGRDNFIQSAEAMGMSRDEAAKLADELGLIPEFVKTEVQVETEKVQESVGQVGDWLSELDLEAEVGADTSGAEEDVHVFGSQVGDVPAKVYVESDLYGAETQLQGFIQSVNNNGGTVSINGETMDAYSALDTIVAEINNGSGTVMINGTPVNAESTLAQLKGIIDNSEGTITIDGNSVPANLKTDGAKSHADGSTGTIDVDANTVSANSSIDQAARGRNSNISASASTGSANSQLNHAARNRHTTITASMNKVGSWLGSQSFAVGGAVHGPGTGTSDSVPAQLSNGEHVITAAEVARAGGQDAIYRMRSAINAGLRFADGGGVENGGYAKAPSFAVAPPAPVAFRPASQDGGNVAQAISAAMSSWQPMVNIGGREFSGVMMQGDQRIKSMGGRR